MNRAIIVSFVTAPLIAAAAFGVFLFSGEGRLDAYAFGSLAVIAVNAVLLRRLPTVARPLRRRLLGAAGVMAQPFVAGWVTGTMLALIHPRYPANEYATRLSYPELIFGGGMRGIGGPS